MSLTRLLRRPLIPLWLALVGCAGGPAPEEPTAGGPTTDQGRGSEPTVEALGGPRDTLVIGAASDFDTSLSVVYQSTHDSLLISQIYGQSYNATFDCSIRYEPEFFERWEFDPSGTMLRVFLRKDLTWADGTPFTARDVKFTYELLADPTVASPKAHYVAQMVPGKAPLVVDDHTVEFHFTQPLSQTTMIAHSGLPILPEHLLRDADRATLRGHPLGRAPVPSGPWKIAKWEAGTTVVLEPNEKFTGPMALRPRLNRVIFRVIPEVSSRLIALQAGEIDAMEGISVADAERLAAEHPEITLHRRGWRNLDIIAWNSIDSADYKARDEAAGAEGEVDWGQLKPHPLFGDPAVRRALSLAVDPDRMIRELLTASNGEVYGRRAVSTITPALCDVHNNDITPLPYDPAAARAGLEAAGWKDTDGDGVLDKDGRPFRFTLLINSGNSRRERAALITQDTLKAVGVDVQIETLESNTFFERLRRKDYDAALSGWAGALFVDMSAQWRSGDKHQYNFTSYNDPEVDRLIDEALATADEAHANALHKQIQARIYEAQPYTFLYWMQDIVGVHQRFRDEQVNLLSAYHDLYRWWVPAAEVKYPR